MHSPFPRLKGASRAKIFVAQLLTRDLFAVDNLLVSAILELYNLVAE